MLENITEIEISSEIQQKISAQLAWHYKVIPQLFESHSASFYIDENQNLEEIKFELKALIQMDIQLITVTSEVVSRALGKYYRNLSNQRKENTTKSIETKDFVDKILSEANQLGSSDIHIEIYQETARIRFRIDGNLIQRFTISKEDYPEIVNKIKIRAKLDISEKRLPQDGRIKYTDFDIRISILPTIYGEKIVLRILGKDASNIDIHSIGMPENDLKNYLEGIKKPNGLVLISGPTGSGKTTTLYATLKLLNDEKRNILTVEDPVEYTLKGINQVQLKEDIGLTFSSTLRSFLRQDPDVVMLGEIRDGETAQMAIRAAMTGHLVLSTIHTNSAWGTISRLEDMGVPSYLLANTINTSVAQRLIRKLCQKCKLKTELNQNDWPSSKLKFEIPEYHWIPQGCDDCHFTGYSGRKAIYEVIPINKELAQMIKEKKNITEVLMNQLNLTGISEKAYFEMTNGNTSLEEVYSLLMN